MHIENPKESTDKFNNLNPLKLCVFSVIYNIYLHNMVIFIRLYKFSFKYLKLIENFLYHMFSFHKFANYNPVIWSFQGIYFRNSSSGICGKNSRILPDINTLNRKATIFPAGCIFKSRMSIGQLQDGRGVRLGDCFPPHKYIGNTSTRGTTPTEHLLNTGRRPQTSQKARNSPRTWVGQKKEEKTETKKRDENCTSGREL